MIKVDIFNNEVDAELLNYRNIPGVFFYRLYSDINYETGGVDFGENNILYEAGNSQIGYNYLLGNIDRQGKFNSILNWVSKERLVYEI